jgi:zinc D-Ala-D-Ala carboxypeptidase
MKYKYRLRTKKPLIVLITIILAIFAAVFYGCNQVEGLFDNNQKTSIPDYESTGKLIREQALESAKKQGFLILVNKQHPIEQEYKPDDLAAMKYYVSDREKSGRYMREPAAVAFSQLVETALLNGIKLKMTTAYRSYDYQKIIYDNYVNQFGEEEANRFSAKPGQSEHQTGLAVDVSSSSVDYELVETFGDTPEGKWLAKNAHEFGFILRYPKGKEDITGYIYESWHLRYVGLFAANEIYQQGVTLEEYLVENGIEQ